MLKHLFLIIFKPIVQLSSALISYAYFAVLRPFYKLLLNRLTNQCELERILAFPKATTARKIKNLTFSLLHSKHNELPALLLITNDDKLHDAIKKIADLKEIMNPEKRNWFEDRLSYHMRLTIGYQELVQKVEDARTVFYDTMNVEHENLLLKLWSLLQSDPLPARITYQWTDIGFQGDDPATDFRGMGLLGLQQLVYFCETRPEKAKQLLIKSTHPTAGYPFAIVGISMTALARDLLQQGTLRNHFFNSVNDKPELKDFHEVYCELFVIFDRFWTKLNPPTIMEFVPIRRQLQETLQRSLSSDSALFKEEELTEC